MTHGNSLFTLIILSPFDYDIDMYSVVVYFTIWYLYQYLKYLIHIATAVYVASLRISVKCSLITKLYILQLYKHCMHACMYIYQYEARNLHFFSGLKNRKLKKYSFFSHCGYYWKMKFYCKWSIFSCIMEAIHIKGTACSLSNTDHRYTYI